MSLVVLLGAVVLGMGLLFCFAGERMFRFFLLLCGMGAGAYAGLLIGGDGSVMVRVLAMLLGGILGVVVSLLLYRVSFLLAGCAAGWGVASGLLGLGPTISAVAAAATGLLGFFGARYFMALATALWGGAAAASGARILLQRLGQYVPPSEVVLAASFALALLGAVAQIRRLRSRSGRE
jgi:hypothetical protein